MRTSKTLLFASMLVAMVSLSISSINAQNFDQNKFYRLTTQWQGEGKSLDVVNDGKNNRVQLAKTGKFTGQYWKITPVGNGHFRLTTQWQGAGKSLDVVNDGKNNQVQLAKTGNFTGQFWKITPVGNGYYRLTTQWQGAGKSLDVVNDGKNNQVQLAKTGNFTGQLWKIDEISTQKEAVYSRPLYDKMIANNRLQKGQELVSSNGSVVLRMQYDGNLAMYRNNQYIWDAKTANKGNYLIMQGDGNLVIYDNSNKPVWSSKTHPYFNAKYRSATNKPVELNLLNNGTFILINTRGNTMWEAPRDAR